MTVDFTSIFHEEGFIFVNEKAAGKKREELKNRTKDLIAKDKGEDPGSKSAAIKNRTKNIVGNDRYNNKASKKNPQAYRNGEASAAHNVERRMSTNHNRKENDGYYINRTQKSGVKESVDLGFEII